MRLARDLRLVLFLLTATLLLGSSSLPQADPIERVRAYTRDIEFDYIAWTQNALGIKLEQLALDPAGYIGREQQRELVLEYLNLVVEIQRNEGELNRIYADPDIPDPQAASAEMRQKITGLYGRRGRLGPLAESLIQSQLSQVIAGLELAIGGQPLPPVLYHSTPLPLALIVSPREVVRQDANISLVPDLTVDQQVALEAQVDRALNISTLVVGIGGIGVYPTMVMQSSDLNWLTEVVAHEWVHNYLTLRPLGINYLTSPELRTMNETAASIAGKEIGRALIARYYPELLPPPPTPAPSTPAAPGEPPQFDFRAEMRSTRLGVDQLLAEGKIEAAESFMEVRRLVFWENGYRIRKINQAYFAFYGAYGDEPGGAAGEDPVGAAVRALRAQSTSLAEFLRRIAWLSSYEQLERAVGVAQ